MMVALAPQSFAKTVKECDAEYSANKAAIKGSGQKKADFVAACRAGTETIPGGAAASTPAAPAPAQAPAAAGGAVKTVSQCDAEYAANKAAIQGSGQKKKDFVAACRAGTETIPAGAPAQAAPKPNVAPAPAPTTATAPAPRTKPAATATNSGGFASDAQAKARCPSDTVVWVNTKSGVYHFAGTHNYGTTKQGTYMCEADAKSAGDRAAENEKHP